MGFKKIPDSRERTEWYGGYVEANAKFNARNSLLKDRALNKAIHEYHERVDTIEINNQLKGIVPDNEAVILPAIDYEITDRALAAQLFFTPVDDYDASQVFQLRIGLTKCLTGVCNQRESPRLYRRKNCTRIRQVESTEEPLQSNFRTDESIMNIEEPLKGTLFCAFCR